MTRIRILFFATLKDLAGIQETTLEVEEGLLVKDLKALLVSKFPGLKEGISTALVAVNKEFAFDEDPIPEDAEIGVFPPVSGGAGEVGADMIQVTGEEIDLNDIITRITLPSTGAVCTFTGTVRAITRISKPHETSCLEYETYQPMAEKKMLQVIGEIRNRWPKVERVAIVQRIGHLDPGTPTVLIACSSPHRDDGVFEAARYGIDRLKEIVPIWKKEIGPEGSEWIEGDYVPKRGDRQHE